MNPRQIYMLLLTYNYLYRIIDGHLMCKVDNETFFSSWDTRLAPYIVGRNE